MLIKLQQARASLGASRLMRESSRSEVPYTASGIPKGPEYDRYSTHSNVCFG